MGWVTVAFYLLAAWLCWKASCAARSHNNRPDNNGRLWIYIALLLLFLGINKQLDLQSALTEAGRILAHANGWYEQRHLVQRVFIGSITVLGVTIFIVGVYAARKEFREMLLALLGVAWLITFVLIRAASFHHVDRFIGLELGSLKMNWLLELGGIALILIGAISYIRNPSSGAGPLIKQ